MPDIDKVVIGTRRRLVSDDFNNGERLRDRALLEGLSAAQLQDAYKSVAAGLGGVLGGFDVRAVAGTLTVEVSPGIAFVPETPADTLYDPPIDYIEQRNPEVIDLSSFVDGGNPRLVTIEVQANQVAKVNTLVDVFDPGTGTFAAVNQDVVVGSDPVFNVRAGAAGASPQVAAGPGVSGFIPLAIVKLSTGLAAFSDDRLPVMCCRPLLAASGKTLIADRTIEGGGISVGEEAGGTFGALQLPEIHDARVELLGIPARARGNVSFSGTVTARTPDTTSPAALLASTGPVYCYLVPPPWASDYGPLAPREAKATNPNQLDLLATPDSIVFGDGSTFTSLGLGFAPLEAGPTFVNCIPIWDDQGPNGIDRGPLSTAPIRIVDARGNTSGSLTLDATQDPSWGNTQVVTESVYIGAVSATGGQFIAQAYRGAGEVWMIDEVDVVAGTGAKPIRRDVADVALTTFKPGGFPSMDQAGVEPTILPTAALWAKVGTVFEGGNLNAVVALIVGANFGSGAADQTLVAEYRVRLDNTSQPAFAADDTFEVGLDASGQAQLAATVAAGGATSILFLQGYKDAFLATR